MDLSVGWVHCVAIVLRIIGSYCVVVFEAV